MASRFGSSLLLVGLVAVVLVTPARAQSSTDAVAEGRWVGCFHEILETAETRSQEAEAAASPEGTCPCFERSDLDALPKTAWDLCLDSAFVVQASSWFGKSSAAGREGFNVLVSAACERTPEGSCQFLHKFRLDGEMQQTYRRLENILPADATACGRIMANWLSSRGGCLSSMVVQTE